MLAWSPDVKANVHKQSMSSKSIISSDAWEIIFVAIKTSPQTPIFYDQNLSTSFDLKMLERNKLTSYDSVRLL